MIWPYLLRALVLTAFFLPPWIMLAWRDWTLEPILPGICVTAIIVGAYVLHVRYYWRLYWCIRDFRTVADERVIVHYAQDVTCDNAERVRAACGTALNLLEEHFGSSLRTRPRIVVVSDSENVRKLDSRHSSGFAVHPLNSVFIAMQRGLAEMVPHELTHLFQMKLSRFRAPPILEEGLAVHFESRRFGRSLEATAYDILRHRKSVVEHLLDREHFFSQDAICECYTLAGSFTRSLIHRHGWQKYCQLYRASTQQTFHSAFEQTIGETLQQAEWKWRNEILVPPVIRGRAKINFRGQTG
jgi:hypothetical protein